MLEKNQATYCAQSRLYTYKKGITVQMSSMGMASYYVRGPFAPLCENNRAHDFVLLCQHQGCGCVVSIIYMDDLTHMAVENVKRKA